MVHAESDVRAEQMLRSAMGEALLALLGESDVLEVMLNETGELWADRLGSGRSFTGEVFHSADAERLIFLVASGNHSECGRSSPILSAELPGLGFRFQGVLPPVTTRPVFMIRKHASFVFPLSEYVSRAELSEKGRERIERAVSRRENILIAGGTGSGKTTFANAVLLEVAKADDRIVIIEDTRELQCSARDSVTLRAREGVADMATLLRATMRLRPDRIVIGEVRGPEVLTMLKAWNTGHPGGCATVHADSGRRALTRLEHLLLECGIQSGKHLVGEAVQLVVYMEKTAAGRRVKEILEVGFDGKAYEFNEVL